METKRVIIVVPYDPRWKSKFQIIKEHLDKALGSSIIEIEHVTSTSVEGLYAKPIIDIDIIIDSYDKFNIVKTLLENLGYYHEGNLEIKDREAFEYRGDKEFMRHNLYVCPQDSGELIRHITFRNHLRTNKDEREKYSQSKLVAAKKYPNDIDKYIEAKSECVNEIYKKCGLEK